MNTLKKFSLQEELKRNPELKKEDLEHLRNWYLKQPHYPKNITDHELVLFLHSNYYRLEPTKVTIENFLSCRTHIPEFFDNRDPIGSKELRIAMSSILIIPLERKTAEGYGVIYSRLINFNPEYFAYNDTMRLYNMIGELWMLQGGTMEGHVFVCDLVGLQMAHALRLNPAGMKKYLYFLQEAAPLRIKGLHFMNIVPVMDFILGIMRPFMKKELIDMLFLHTTLDSIAKYLPIEILPNEAGGKAGSMMDLYSKVLKNIEDHRAYFLDEQETMRLDESLRPENPKTSTDLFGIDGSFKQLNFD